MSYNPEQFSVYKKCFNVIKNKIILQIINL